MIKSPRLILAFLTGLNLLNYLDRLVVSAVLRRDYPVIQGALLVVAALYVIINFLIDMLYLVVDPRVRY